VVVVVVVVVDAVRKQGWDEATTDMGRARIGGDLRWWFRRST
jgi:CRISPR/Cas system CMR-associated protein Cmr1 (group 7 of RAMP superfamily)